MGLAVLYLICAVIASGAWSIFSDLFALKSKDGKNTALAFNLIICVSSFLCWMVYAIIDGDFEVATFPYSIGLGFTIFAAFLLSQLAYEKGQASIVTLISQFSLILVAVYGFFFWDSEFSVFKAIGLVLIFASLFLLIYKKGKDKKYSYLWLVFALGAMVANAACSIITKSQQIKFENHFGPSYMAFGTLISCLLSIAFLTLNSKDVEVRNIKKTIAFPIVAGVANFALNLFVILLAGTEMSPTIIYPVISLSVVLVLLYSLVYKKERLTIMQWIGMGVGIAAIVFLSL